ncbi:DUF636 domain-containing protein [Microsporum canis CBS 113480]|uniref:DUF636 domain-containing protein n=1 Tax=Arthroderma otae (strain ATCC MYA-4605 / CBS 113480) TaxID=554155 RepID=C5FW85_ARTOC|nr:DUF636 domain-containing protein [Microsporum canis CBS 113480]EEQ34169.1 DUF636 domain-containing protein [Microsporum canis CBS 113480]
MSSSSVVLQGGCCCKKIRYTSTTLPKSMSNCFCITCRKISGAPYATFSRFPRSSITWLNELPKYFRSSNFAKRGYCGDCGSTLTYEMDERPDSISLCPGSFDDWDVKGELMKPTDHIFLGEKAVWFDVPNDGLSRFTGDDEEPTEAKTS